MKIAKLETFLTNSGLRNYLFLRQTTDTGLAGVGEASLEWQERAAEQIVAAGRQAVGDEVELMIEVHGRLSVGCAIEMGRRLAPYRPAWLEEPVTPHSLDLLLEVKQALDMPIAAGERLYMLEEFQRLTALRACDVVQMDL